MILREKYNNQGNLYFVIPVTCRIFAALKIKVWNQC
jgi:hypothetical protein